MDPSLLIVSRLKAMDQCYEADGCKVMYYGAIRGFERRGAALPALSLAAGFVSALDKGNARQTMTHEMGHLLDQRHTTADPPGVPLHPLGFKQGPCGGDSQITLLIDMEPPAELADLAVDLLTGLEAPPPAETAHTLSARVENRGPDPVGDATLQIGINLTDFAAHPGAVAKLTNPQPPPGWSCQIDALALSCSPAAMAAFTGVDIGFDVLIDRPALLNMTATVNSAISDPAGANNQSSVNYPIAASDRVFSNGFEAGL